MAVVCQETLVAAASPSCTFLVLGMVWETRLGPCKGGWRQKGSGNREIKVPLKAGAACHSEGTGSALERHLAPGTACDRAPAAPPGPGLGRGHASHEDSGMLPWSHVLHGDKSEPCERSVRRRDPGAGSVAARAWLCLRVSPASTALPWASSPAAPRAICLWSLLVPQRAPFVRGSPLACPLPCAAPVPPQQRSLAALRIISRRDFWIGFARQSALHPTALTAPACP